MTQHLRNRFTRSLRKLFVEQLEPRAMLAADSDSAAFFPEELRAEGETTPIVRYSVETVVAGTNTPLTSITNGRDFDVRVLVEDLRLDGNPNRGVFAGYLDLLYDKSLGRVRVFEVQTLSIASAPATGSFTLTLNPGQTTAPINYSVASASALAANAGLIQTALNNLLGAGSVIVTRRPSSASYDIRFVALADIDQPSLQPSNVNVTVVETVKGDPNLPASFTEAFRSRAQALDGAGPYQNGLSAINAIDRVDELGGVVAGQIAPIGNGTFELARARMTATLPVGQPTRVLTFTPDFSQLVLPAHATQVFADVSIIPPEDQNVPLDAIVGVSTSLTITSVLTAASGVAQVGEDDPAGVNVPIIPLVTKNPGAPAGLIELRSFTQPATGGTVTRLDPNGTPTNFSDDLVRFIPAADFSGTATFTYTAGIVGNPILADEATNTITVTVTPVNDAPVNTVPGPQNVVEDTPLVFSIANGNQIRIADVDADPAGVRVTLSASTGALSLAQTTGLAFTLGDGVSDSVMTFAGSTSDVNNALASVTFLPALNSTAAVTLTITTSDIVAGGSGGLKQDQDTVAITITGVNDAPVVAAPAAQTAFTLNALTFSPAFNNAIVVSDVDAGSDAITVTLTAAGGIGTLTANPAALGAQIQNNGTANVTISGSQAAITAALSGLTLTPPANAAAGAITIVADDQGRNPGPPRQGQAVVNITVSVPAGPFAVNDNPANLVEGGASYTIDVLANDLATAGNKAVIISFTQPPAGTVTLDNNNTPADPTDDKLVYSPPLKNAQPDLDFFTPASVPPVAFTYVANQSPGAGTNSPPGTVAIRIANNPDPPIANNDGLNNSYATSIGVPLTRNAAQGVLANDTSVDNAYGDASVAVLTVLGASVGNPLLVNTAAGGTVTLNVDGSFTYTPPVGFGNNDTFTYRAHSSLGPDSTPATVTIHVSAPPTAGNDNFTTAQEDQVFTSASSVLLNDSDFSDGEQLSAELLTNVPANAGVVSLSPGGIVTYTPALNFNTTRPAAPPITFTYRVTTPLGRVSAPATVSLTVNDTNDNPTAVGDTFDAVQQKGQLGLNQTVLVLGNDSIAPDVNETLSVTGVNGVSASAGGNTAAVPTTGGGSVKLEGFVIKYTSPTVTGNDSFTYTISDGRGGTSTATVQVTVLPPFDYGDAVDTFGTTIFSNGARHFAIGPQLGLLRDEEGNGFATAAANGDDLDGQDDEDGLTAHLLLRGKSSSFTVQVVAGPAKLDAWIDFDRNGTFDASEQVANSVTVSSGSNPVGFTVPAAALLGPTTARFRLSTAGGAGPTGVAADGEVEDHIVTVLQDLEINLPTGNGADRVSIRKNNTDVEVFNIPSASPLGTSPLVFTNAVIVNGSATEPDEIIVDYAFGGFPVVPGGILLNGGASGGDLLTIQGAAAGTNTAEYLSDGLSLGNATLRTSAAGVNHDVLFTNFEPLTVNSMASFTATGALNVGPDTLTLSVAAPANLGALTTLASGTINAAAGVALLAGQTLLGRGTVNGSLAGAAGSTIEATGPLTLGSATSNTGFATSGELKIGAHSVTLQSATAPVLGTLTTLGSGAVGGTLNSNTGLALAAANKIQGLGTINTPNNASAAIVNNGVMQGNSAGEKLTLAGHITGTGILDNVIITGTYSPGASPAAVQLGSVSFSPTAKLLIEVSGKTAGSQFDQLNLTGAAVLGGTLELVLQSGFVPAIPDSFAVINAAAGVTGAFSTVTLPPLTGRQRWWDTTPVGNQLQLLVSPTHPRHNPRNRYDVNDDGSIVPGDALSIINIINAFGARAVIPSPTYYAREFYDVTGTGEEPDNFVAANDALAIINLINAGLAGGEGESAADAAASRSQAFTPPQRSDLADTIALLALDLSEQAARRRRSR